MVSICLPNCPPMFPFSNLLIQLVGASNPNPRPPAPKAPVKGNEVTPKSLQPVIAIRRGTYFQESTQLGRQLLLDDNFDIPKN